MFAHLFFSLFIVGSGTFRAKIIQVLQLEGLIYCIDASVINPAIEP